MRKRQKAGCTPLDETPEICSIKPMTGFYRDGCCALPTEGASDHFLVFKAYCSVAIEDDLRPGFFPPLDRAFS